MYSYEPVGEVTTIVPSGVLQDGCVMEVTATDGALGCAFTVIAVGDETQVLSPVRVTVRVWVPGVRPAKVTDAWYEPPSILYWYSPVGEVTTTVPVEVEQVGWVMLATAAAATLGCAFTVTIVAVEIHP